MKKIYLDYAAATPLDERVAKAMQPYLADDFYNPSATYLPARQARGVLEDARQRVAMLLGVRSAEITFTAGATAANLAVVQNIKAAFPGKHLLVGAAEHPSVLEAAGPEAREIPVTSEGVVDLSALERLVTDDTVLVSVAYANNEVGVIQPLREVGAILAHMRDQRRRAVNQLPLYFHTDASQAANYLDLHVSRLGVDYMVLNASKAYGPKRTGVLYARAGLPVDYHGGSDDVAGAVGCVVALELAQAERHVTTSRLQALQRLFIEQLRAQIPGVELNGSLKNRLPNNVHVTLPGQDNEWLLMELDEDGIMAAAGSACTASSEEPSHVLLAMGRSAQDARSSLRFTMGRETTEADVRKTVATLAALVAG